MQGMLQAVRHLALIALILRAMLPAGWMPDAQSGLVICSATLGAIHHDSADGKTSHDGQAQQQECPFAASVHSAPAPAAPALALPALHAFIARIDRGHAAVIAARFSPASPRAPPARV